MNSILTYKPWVVNLTNPVCHKEFHVLSRPLNGIREITVFNSHVDYMRIVRYRNRNKPVFFSSYKSYDKPISYGVTITAENPSIK